MLSGLIQTVGCHGGAGPSDQQLLQRLLGVVQLLSTDFVQGTEACNGMSGTPQSSAGCTPAAPGEAPAAAYSYPATWLPLTHLLNTSAPQPAPAVSVGLSHSTTYFLADALQLLHSCGAIHRAQAQALLAPLWAAGAYAAQAGYDVQEPAGGFMTSLGAPNSTAQLAATDATKFCEWSYGLRV